MTDKITDVIGSYRGHINYIMIVTMIALHISMVFVMFCVRYYMFGAAFSLGSYI